MTDRLRPDQIDTAATLLRAGELVAFPTETVYGLGARADDDMSVARVFAAKERPDFNPLIVHVPSLSAARDIAKFDQAALQLAHAFWPGPMTLVLPLRPDTGISQLVSAGLDTVAIRVPAHPLAQKLLQAVALPIAAPSANPSGRISPTTADHVLDGLGGKIAAVLDGGACDVGLESTIITPVPLQLLRPGGISVDQIQSALGAEISVAAPGDTPTAPGQLKSHYAPGSSVRLNAINPHLDEVFLGFGAVENATLNLSPDADLTQAAANLFAMLHQIDAMAGGSTIAVSPIPQHGLGLAINDRLARAAAPRGQA